MPDHVFTEEEIKAIIRRAAARQEEEAEREEAREHGLTLADLERLGEEVGLDPRHLRAAADEVRTGRATGADAETQTDTHVIVERRIDRPFTPEVWEDTVTLLRQRFGVDMGMWYGRSGEGRIEQVGRAHEWVHMSQLGVETRVSASEREGQTRLILSQRVGQASSKVEGFTIAATLGLVVGVFAAIGVADALDSFAAFALVWVAITALAAVAGGPVVAGLDRRWRDKKQRKLKDLAADIEDVFESAAPRSVERMGSPEAAPRVVESESAARGQIDLDSLPDEAGDARRTERSRTRS
jgi:diadenosine tetraphosphate (Ap4A) HIT family hydrolase